MPSDYRINIRKENGDFILYNHDAIAGDRLFKGEVKGNFWPFKEIDWNRYKTERDAVTAKKALQSYLERTENK